MLCQSVPFSNVVQDMNQLRCPIPKSLSSGKGLTIASLKASIFSVISTMLPEGAKKISPTEMRSRHKNTKH